MIMQVTIKIEHSDNSTASIIIEPGAVKIDAQLYPKELHFASEITRLMKDLNLIEKKLGSK